MAVNIGSSGHIKKSEPDRPIKGRHDRSSGWTHVVYSLIEAFHWPLHYVMHGISIRALAILIRAGNEIADQREKRRKKEDRFDPSNIESSDDYPEEAVVNPAGLGRNFFTN